MDSPLNTWLLAHEAPLRLGIFFGVLAVMMGWEALAPRRRLALARRARWPANLGIVALNTVVARLVFPVAPVGVALWAEARGWGLLAQVDLPLWAEAVITVVVLDLVIYGQHVMVHHVPVLWRLHRMHHADTGFDVTTGARFHPLEILLSLAIKMAAVVVLGAPAVGVLVFEVLLNATAMFNHGNVGLPAGLDRVLRWITVTPDMHRVHHSDVVRETNSNYGFNLPWWDRLFGTYTDQPAAGQLGFTIGLETFRDPAEARLDRLLTQPFRNN